jgi:uncharacterized protein
MPITALYAGLLAPLFIFLAVRVVSARRGARVAVGDGGDATLLRRMRVHANCAENVPFALILMALAESLSTAAWLLHILGISLLLGRCAHAFGMSQTPDASRNRDCDHLRCADRERRRMPVRGVPAGPWRIDRADRSFVRHATDFPRARRLEAARGALTAIGRVRMYEALLALTH